MPCDDTVRKWTFVNREESSPDTESSSALIPDFLVSRTMTNQCLLFKTPSLCCYSIQTHSTLSCLSNKVRELQQTEDSWEVCVSLLSPQWEPVEALTQLLSTPCVRLAHLVYLLDDMQVNGANLGWLCFLPALWPLPNHQTASPSTFSPVKWGWKYLPLIIL